jgi:hypothetical protein
MRDEQNRIALERIYKSNPIWMDIMPAKDIVPGMTDHTILHSGPPIAWADMIGGQRQAVIGACIYEGLATNEQEVDDRMNSGDIILSPCQDHNCIGSLTGIYYPSMPVFVVKNETYGNTAFCSIYESSLPERITYGVYNKAVFERLDFIHQVVAPILKDIVLQAGGIPIKPIMVRALRMGDELHSRNMAATTLFIKEMMPYLIQMTDHTNKEKVLQFIEYMKKCELFFLHLGMAASKSTADAIYGIEGCSIVTAMAMNGRDFGIRVSTFGNRWFTAPIPAAEAKLFPGIKQEDLAYMGGESLINETMGLGGFAQACSFPLQDYSGGTPDRMVENNRLMYEITVGEHPDFLIPYFKFRGVPVGIDIFLVAMKKIEPLINMGMALKTGGHAGAGILKAPLSCFEAAVTEYTKLVGSR